MKKGLLVLSIILMVTGYAFAQNYTVESMTGLVQKESGNNRVNLRTGEILNPDTVIHTAAGSSLSLKLDDRIINIPATRSGKVSDLASIGSGLRISGNIARVETAAVTRVGGHTSTASARASDAAANDDIAAE